MKLRTIGLSCVALFLYCAVQTSGQNADEAATAEQRVTEPGARGCSKQHKKLFGEIEFEILSPKNKQGGYDARSCEWNITSYPGHVVYLHVLYLKLKNEDTLTVYDGPTRTSPVLQQFTGHPLESWEGTSSSRYAFVEFKPKGKWSDPGGGFFIDVITPPIYHEDKLTCGKTDTNLLRAEDAHASGMEGREHSFPWHVLLRSKEIELYQCSGAIISWDFVLTVSSCLEYDRVKLEPSPHFQIIAGATDILEGDKDASGDKLCFLEAKSFHRHPLYTSRLEGDDIALIKLKKPIPKDELRLLRPACLFKKSLTTAYADGANAVMTGFSFPYLEQEYNDPDREYTYAFDKEWHALHQVKLRIAPRAACQRDYFDTFNWTKAYNDKRFCASPVGENFGFGRLDSGSPVVYEHGKDKRIYYVLGMPMWRTTNVHGLMRRDLNSIEYQSYTSVEKYLEWIKQVIAGEKEDLGNCSYGLILAKNGQYSPRKKTFQIPQDAEGQYMNNLDCHWEFIARPHQKFNFYVSKLKTQESVDELRFFEGTRLKPGHIIQTFSGDGTKYAQANTIYSSRTNRMYVNFRSDGSVHHRAPSFRIRIVSKDSRRRRRYARLFI